MRDVAYIALGSNLGDREEHLARARAALAVIPESRILGESSVEETAPLGPIAQRSYLNQMIALETTLDPHVLLTHLHAIEETEGRVRRERWGSRTLDLDIVQFETQTVNATDLLVPHPELPNRDFWQRELTELKAGA
ncbi:MAG TPA: 2-amino-4-hydroxy-6-hydroxymethyldihydropteridine diphosphokinase [Gemmatimonadaceae bacterium]